MSETEVGHMPIGYSRGCKVCNSVHRAQIEQWCGIEGLTPITTSERLQAQFGESIGKTSIWRHMQNHWNLQVEVRAEYTAQQVERINAIAGERVLDQSRDVLERGVRQRLSDLDILDDMIATDYSLYKKAAEMMKTAMNDRDKPKIPLAATDAMGTFSKSINQTMKTKLELLGVDAEGRKAGAIETWVDLLAEDTAT